MFMRCRPDRGRTLPHMARAGLGRIRSAGPETFARAINGHLGPATTSTAVALRRPARAESLDGITLRDRRCSPGHCRPGATRWGRVSRWPQECW